MRPKYGNRKTVVDNITFASAKEAKRYGELKLLERAGAIYDLVLQPRHKLAVNGRHVCTYVPDFSYCEQGRGVVIEDVKGVRTPAYVIKAKLFHAVLGIQVTEI